MTKFAWIVLALIAGFFCASLGDGAGLAGVIDIVLGLALLPVFYIAVSRDPTAE